MEVELLVKTQKINKPGTLADQVNADIKKYLKSIQPFGVGERVPYVIVKLKPKLKAAHPDMLNKENFHPDAGFQGELLLCTAYYVDECTKIMERVLEQLMGARQAKNFLKFAFERGQQVIGTRGVERSFFPPLLRQTAQPKQAPTTQTKLSLGMFSVSRSSGRKRS